MDIAEHARGNAVRDPSPGLTVVSRFVDERIAIIYLMKIHRNVGGARVVARCLDVGHGAPLGQAGDVRGDIGPGLAAVARYLYQAVVTASPDHALLFGRFGERENDANILDTDVVAGEAAGELHFALGVACQIRTDYFPTVSLIRCVVDVLAGDVNAIVAVRRESARTFPLSAVRELGGERSAGLIRPHFDVARLVIALIEHGDDAAHAAGA